jgi:hypothetical protein
MLVPKKNKKYSLLLPMPSQTTATNTFAALRTVAPTTFGATVRRVLVQALNLNPASVGSTVTLTADAATGFATFRLQAAYQQIYYRPAQNKAAAEAALKAIIADFHQRQKRVDATMPPLFGDYLHLESLTPVYRTAMGTPLLHYWQAQLVPRFANPLYEKPHSLAHDYTPNLPEKDKKNTAAQQPTIALPHEYVTIDFADRSIIGLEYQHTPVLQTSGTEPVALYANAAANTLLLRRKNDLLLPVMRLPDGREVAACAESEGLAEGALKRVNTLPTEFDRGKDGRILFENGRIIVVLHICFYGGGFDALFDALRRAKEADLIKPDDKDLHSWLNSKRTAIDADIEGDKLCEPKDKRPNLLKVSKQNFTTDLVQYQANFIARMLNEFTHTAYGPDNGEYPVHFEIHGNYYAEDTTKSLMHGNVKMVDGKRVPANNALLFLRLEAIDMGGPHNSIMGNLTADKRETCDNSIMTSTLHLSTTALVHEVIVHPFWGRGKFIGQEHLDPDWVNNPIGYPTIPSIRFVDYDPPRTEATIKNLPENLKIQGTNRLDKSKRKVLPPDILLADAPNMPIKWNKITNSAWVGDATNTFFDFQKSSLNITQYTYKDKQEPHELKSGNYKPDGSNGKIRLLWLICIVLFATSLSACLGFKQQQIQKKCLHREDSLCANYRNRVKNGDFDFYYKKDLALGCQASYTKKEIEKKLGKPFRIHKGKTGYEYNGIETEDWIYVRRQSLEEGRKLITAVYIFPFSMETNRTYTPGKGGKFEATFFATMGGCDPDDFFNFWNQDSLDIKIPYIFRDKTSAYGRL